MTRHKVYGIARHDVMMPQDCEVPEIRGGLHHMCGLPASGRWPRREPQAIDHRGSALSHVCKRVRVRDNLVLTFAIPRG